MLIDNRGVGSLDCMSRFSERRGRGSRILDIRDGSSQGGGVVGAQVVLFLEQPIQGYKGCMIFPALEESPLLEGSITRANWVVLESKEVIDGSNIKLVLHNSLFVRFIDQGQGFANLHHFVILWGKVSLLLTNSTPARKLFSLGMRPIQRTHPNWGPPSLRQTIRSPTSTSGSARIVVPLTREDNWHSSSTEAEVEGSAKGCRSFGEGGRGGVRRLRSSTTGGAAGGKNNNECW